MNPKMLMYAIVTIITFVALDAININAIFKKNRVFQARLFYFLLAIIIIYIVTNFIYDVVDIVKIF